MSELQAGKKTVLELLGNEKANFHIPSYQRPYAWGVDECETLWDDVSTFTVPNNDPNEFLAGSEYFLGPLVTYREDGTAAYEVIDGQQRLTTLMLLLRVIYSRLEHMKDEDNEKLRKDIEKAIWKAGGEFGQLQAGAPKLESSVASDRDLEELASILATGEVRDFMQSRYAINFMFFQNAVDEYVNLYPDYFKYLVNRLLRNVILLPIESEDRDSALRIFSTLNNRGLPLSDSDIFKAVMYEEYRNQGREEEFDTRWKDLEQKLAGPLKAEDSPMTELFRLYMGYLRGLDYTGANRPKIRDFYSKNHNEVLKKEETLSGLEDLADFWNRFEGEEGFSDEVLKDFLVLKYAPNKLWQDAISNYYLTNRNDEGRLNQEQFHEYLQKMIAFIYGALAAGAATIWERREIDKEAGYLAGKVSTTPFENRFSEQEMYDALEHLSPWKRINKGILAWWMMSNEAQKPFDLNTDFDVEHIYARKRHQNHPDEITDEQLESLGNKSLLEKRINIRAADYDFCDKCDIYIGNRSSKKGTDVQELLDLAQEEEFSAKEIDERTEKIKSAFIEFLKSNGLVAMPDKKHEE